jgi:hypothetical protein
LQGSCQGCFLARLYKAKTKTGFAVQLRFQITQHTRDAQLMKSLVTYLDCGRIHLPSGYAHGNFLVGKFSDINEKIIPFFDKYQIEGVKALDLADFKRVAAIMKVNGHTTESGLEEIRLIKAGMNRGRS